MEISQNYRGFGITYQTFDGTTTVHDMGFPMKVFSGYGEIITTIGSGFHMERRIF